MKGKKCIKFLTFFITLVLSFVLFSKDTNAVEYNDAYYRDVSNATLYYNNGGYLTFVTSNGGAYWAGSGIQNTSGVKYLSIGLSSSLNSPAIVTLIIKTQAPIGTYPQIAWGARSYAYNVINETYGEYGTAFITLYLERNLTGSIDLTPTGFGNFTSADIQISPIYTVTLNETPTRSQINTIASTLNSMFADLEVTNANVNNINTNVTNILSEIRNMSSDTERTADAVEEQNEKDDEDRSNLESQSSDTDTEANQQGDEATQTGNSLFGAFTQLLGALTNINGNTCTLPAMQVYTLNLGNMNLCQYDIPPQIMALVSIGMVFIIIPLGINLVKRMISLYKEITG